LRHLPRPGLDLRKAFGFVRDDVLQVTHSRQEPFIYGSLGGDDVALVPALPQKVVAVDPAAGARGDYELAQQINVVSAWNAFINKYPSGFYTDLAKAQRDKLVAAKAMTEAAEKKAPDEAKVADKATEKAAEADRAKAAQLKAADDARIAAEKATLAEEIKAADAARAKAATQKVEQNSRLAAAVVGNTNTDDARKREEPRLPLPCTSAQVAALSSSAARGLSPPEECGLRPKDVFRECVNCPEMVVVPSGEVLIGSNASDIDSGLAAANEAPQHRAVVKQPIAVGRFEITRDQYAAFVQSAGYKPSDRCYTFENNLPQERTGRSFLNPGFVQDGNHPAVCVSWTDAKAYVQWLAQTTGKPYRLLSEAEFEYAARAGSRSRFGFSDDTAELCKFVNGADRAAKNAGLPADAAYMNCSDSYPFTAPVGSLAANAFGLSDMIGNVWEWTEDCFYGDYATAGSDSAARVDAGCTSHAVRGGDWFSTEASLRPAVRAKANADARHDDIGFRVARTLGP
jgi:formylglycine-generating enzyme required for sulfatase activity